MRLLLLLAALLCAAVGASAAVVVSRNWTVTQNGTPRIYIMEVPGGVELRATAPTGQGVIMTRDEAASLGRALLEAAGQPEKVCPAPMPYQGCLTVPSLNAIPTTCVVTP